MEERIPQPEQQRPASIAAAPGDGDDAPVVQVVSSGEESSDEGEFEFEFPFVSRDSPAGTADELFADGRIRPFYPVFGCVHGARARPAPAAALGPPRVRGQLGRLFLEETLARDSSSGSTTSSSSAATDDDGGGLEGAAPESYCVWRPGGGGSDAPVSPSPRRPPRKSGSTGSMARWRRISDLVVGRSHSDGKDKFVFFAAPPADTASSKDRPRPRPPRTTTTTNPPAAGDRKAPPPALPAAAEFDTAHRMGYLGNNKGPGGTPRRTFLPYREELVGLFANVNGVSRSHQHPF